MAGFTPVPYIQRVGGILMFVGLGLVMMLVATYGLFAWQLSLGRIATLCVAGILLMAAQFLRIQKDSADPTGAKGEFHGSR